MEINKDAINKIKGLNDSQLRDAIGQIADVIGATPVQKRRAQNNLNYIRRKLNDGKDNDLIRQINSIDPQTQAEILRRLKL